MVAKGAFAAPNDPYYSGHSPAHPIPSQIVGYTLSRLAQPLLLLILREKAWLNVAHAYASVVVLSHAYIGSLRLEQEPRDVDLATDLHL